MSDQERGDEFWKEIEDRDFSFQAKFPKRGPVHFTFSGALVHFIESRNLAKTEDALHVESVCRNPERAFRGLYRHDHDKSYCFVGPALDGFDSKKFLFAVFFDQYFEIFEWGHEKRDKKDPSHPERGIAKRFDSELNFNN